MPAAKVTVLVDVSVEPAPVRARLLTETGLWVVIVARLRLTTPVPEIVKLPDPVWLRPPPWLNTPAVIRMLPVTLSVPSAIPVLVASIVRLPVVACPVEEIRR